MRNKIIGKKDGCHVCMSTNMKKKRENKQEEMFHLFLVIKLLPVINLSVEKEIKTVVLVIGRLL